MSSGINFAPSSPAQKGPNPPSDPPSAASGSKKEFWLDPCEYELRKTLPPRFANRKNDVYVTRKTNFKAQEARCAKLLDSTLYDEIYVHGLGAAINRAINLCLQLERKYMGTVKLETVTSTVEVTDHMQALMDEGESKTRKRYVSAVHIRVYRNF